MPSEGEIRRPLTAGVVEDGTAAAGVTLGVDAGLAVGLAAAATCGLLGALALNTNFWPGKMVYGWGMPLSVANSR